jgi:hypothetical protein
MAEDPQSPNLSKNFRLTVSGKKGDQSLGELSALTCSPEISMDGYLDASPLGTMFAVTGNITEQAEQIKFRYNISFRTAVETPSSRPGGPTAGTNLSFDEHSCSGSLLMKVGKAHEVFRSAGVVYTVLIAPEE